MGKLVTLGEAARLVGDGDSIALGGFAITRCAVAFAHELVRTGRRDLTVCQASGGLDTDLLAGGGCLRRIVSSGGSLDRFGPLHSANRRILAGEIEFEEYSNLAVTFRFLAGALGLPYVAAKTMLGSDLLASLDPSSARLEQDPFTGEPVVALPPLHPDVAVVHVDVADADGNATVAGPTWNIRETALAARRTVLLAEELAERGSLDPDAIVIPAPFVTAVGHVPFGAYPTAVQGRYDYDRAHLELYAAAARDGGDAYAGYLERYVHGAGSHERFLELAEAVA
jgi:glutaconate CoA-transferase, subunit A